MQRSVGGGVPFIRDKFKKNIFGRQ